MLLCLGSIVRKYVTCVVKSNAEAPPVNSIVCSPALSPSSKT
ncbi:MAG TPA: hypothetical protein VHJ38_15345 [Nitrososphaeraceae archaeon]|nr:hypothetical protein [Nitrososphaeraceae archaeon]